VIKALKPNPRPAYSWPRIQVRLHPDTIELLKVYAMLCEVKGTAVIRTLIKSHLARVFGRGVGVGEALERVKSLDPQSTQELIMRIKGEFEALL
jgi:hypothetical protein